MKKKRFLITLICICLFSCKKNTMPSDKDSDQKNDFSLKTFNLKDGKKINAAVMTNGDHIVSGDMLLSQSQIDFLNANDKSKIASTESAFITSYYKYWPSGAIPYVINDFQNNSKIATAIAEWEAKTSLVFIPRTNQTNYIDFVNNPNIIGSGESYVGMTGGRQELRLRGPVSVSTIVHEIGHAVGLLHEHTRRDRDDYITINWSNIKNNWTFAFEINSGEVSELGPFDFMSVMLYGSYGPDAGYPGNTTPQWLEKGTQLNHFGQRWELSQGDVEGVNFLYLGNPNGLPVAKMEYNNISSTDGISYYADVYIAFYTNYYYNTPIVPSSSISFNYAYRVGHSGGHLGGWHVHGNSPAAAAVTNSSISNTMNQSKIFIGRYLHERNDDFDDPQYGFWTEQTTTKFSVKPGSGYNHELDWWSWLSPDISWH